MIKRNICLIGTFMPYSGLLLCSALTKHQKFAEVVETTNTITILTAPKTTLKAINLTGSCKHTASTMSLIGPRTPATFQVKELTTIKSILSHRSLHSESFTSSLVHKRLHIHYKRYTDASFILLCH